MHCGPPSYHELMHIADKNKWNIWYLNVFLHEVSSSLYSCQVRGGGRSDHQNNPIPISRARPVWEETDLIDRNIPRYFGK